MGERQEGAGIAGGFHEREEEGRDGQAKQEGSEGVEAAHCADDAHVTAGGGVLNPAHQRAREPQECEDEGKKAEGDVDQECPAPAAPVRRRG